MSKHKKKHDQMNTKTSGVKTDESAQKVLRGENMQCSDSGACPEGPSLDSSSESRNSSQDQGKVYDL